MQSDGFQNRGLALIDMNSGEWCGTARKKAYAVFVCDPTETDGC